MTKVDPKTISDDRNVELRDVNAVLDELADDGWLPRRFIDDERT